MIKFQNVTKSYENGISSLYDVSFDIEEGEFAFLIGPSGAGKTTALRLIIREDVPSQGEIVISDYNLTTMPKRYLPSLRRQIGVIFQDFKLLPGLTVAENISFILEISGKSDKEIEETVHYLLNVVNLTERANLYPQQLSGGEQQRVSIARAIANDPAIVLADEPTGNLDPENAAQVMDLLRQINSWGTTVMISTHDPELVNEQRSRVLALDSGKLVKDYVGDYLDDDTRQATASKPTDANKKSTTNFVEELKSFADHHDKKEKKIQKLELNVDSKAADFNEEAWEDLVQKNTEEIIFEKDTLQNELNNLEDNPKSEKPKKPSKKIKKSKQSKSTK